MGEEAAFVDRQTGNRSQCSHVGVLSRASGRIILHAGREIPNPVDPILVSHEPFAQLSKIKPLVRGIAHDAVVEIKPIDVDVDAGQYGSQIYAKPPKGLRTQPANQLGE